MTWQNYKCKTLSSSLIIQRTTSVYSFVLFFISGWKRWGSQPIRCSRGLISVGNSSVSAGAFWGAELSLLNVLQHVSFASVSSPGHGLQREGRLFWIPLPVPHRWLQGVPGDTAGHGRAKQKVCVCVWCVSLCGVRCLSRVFWTCRRLQTLSCLCLHFRIPRRTRVENRV